MIYAHGASHGAYAHLGEVACPVALSCGERTDAFGPSFLEADAARLPRSTIEIIPVLGHFGPLQQPAVVATSVIKALKPVSGTPSP